MGANTGHHRTARHIGTIGQEPYARRIVAGVPSLGAALLLISAICLVALAMLSIGTSAAAAQTPFDFKHPKNLGYREARSKLIRAGYRPLRLQHDSKDECWHGFCEWYPEALNCGGMPEYICYFIFEKPASRSLRPKNRYVVVVTEGEPDPEGKFRNAQVDFVKAPDKYDLLLLWQREDLKHRGCGPEDEILFRDCPSLDPSPKVPELPPLPLPLPLPPPAH